MEKNLLLIFGVIWVSCILTSQTLPVFPTFNAIISKLSDTTTDVLNGISEVVEDGLNLAHSAVSAIIDKAGSVRDKIIRLLEEFRKCMTTGILELSIPVLEPLTIDYIDLNVDSLKIGKIEGYAAKVVIRRLSEFIIDYVNWNTNSELTVNITFPRIDVQGNYSISGVIGKPSKKKYSIHGKGPFWMQLRGLSLGTITQLRYDVDHDPHFHVEHIQIDAKLKKLKNNFANLMNDTLKGNIFNKLLSKTAPQSLDKAWPAFEPRISRQVIKIINSKLEVYQPSSILKKIINFLKLN